MIYCHIPGAVVINYSNGKNGTTAEYTVAALTQDIASTTQAKDSFVREAQGKESRLFTLLDGLAALWQDGEFMDLLKGEQLDKRPELSGTYTMAPVAESGKAA